MKPKKKQVKEFWGLILGKKVEQRFGFYDESGFVEMQSNPYSKAKHDCHEKALCYLEEDRPLTDKEKAEYSEDLDKGMILAIPDRAECWLPVPRIDLNNLFKWAVPEVIKFIGDKSQRTDEEAMNLLFSLWFKEFWTPRATPISIKDALFWAIYKVIKEE